MDSTIVKAHTKKIEAVVKLTERCNINCTYCYMFNKGNEDYKENPVAMPDEVVHAIGAFLAEGARDLSATHIQIDFHGGEPLMMKKAKFDWMCSTLLESLKPVAIVKFGVQTNAMLVDEDWITIFSKYSINPGISIDGPKEYHDVARLDHRGRGTYAAVAHGISLIRKARDIGLIGGYGALCVINPNFDAKRVYRHFVDDLGFTNMDFLLPIDSHDSFDFSSTEKYGKFLCDLFDEWTTDDDPKISIRMFIRTMSFLSGGKHSAKRWQEPRSARYQLISISSGGDLGPDDALKPLNQGIFKRHNIKNCSLVDFVNSTLIQDINYAERTLPTDCMECCWQNFCRGGAEHGRLINRYSSRNGFDNRSVVCKSLQDFYSHVAAYLLRHGVPYERLTEALDSPIFPIKTTRPMTIRGANSENKYEVISRHPIAH